MQRKAARTRWLGGALLVGAVLFGSGLIGAGDAFAHDAGGAQLPTDPPAVTPDGQKANAELASVSKDDAAAEAVKEGTRALGRAHGASLAGDVDGARLLSRLALAWANAATTATRAKDAEVAATAEETRAKEVADKLTRAKLTLRETESRKGQLVAEVARVEAEAKKTTNASLATEQKRVTNTPATSKKTPPKKSDGKAKSQ